MITLFGLGRILSKKRSRKAFELVSGLELVEVH